MHKLAAHKTYFLQALDRVDELRGVDGKEGQLARGRGAPSVPQRVSASGNLDPRDGSNVLAIWNSNRRRLDASIGRGGYSFIDVGIRIVSE